MCTHRLDEVRIPELPEITGSHVVKLHCGFSPSPFFALLSISLSCVGLFFLLTAGSSGGCLSRPESFGV